MVISGTRLTVALILLIVAACLWSGYPRTGQAHAGYERSEPPADTIIPESPAEVHIWFTQELFRRAGANTLVVFGSAGAQVDNDDARIDDDDRSHMLVSLQSGLADGLYTVTWRTLSVEDGHEGSGDFSFTVDSEAISGETPPADESPLPVPNPTLPSAPASQTGGGLPCLGGLIAGALLGGLVWLHRGQP